MVRSAYDNSIEVFFFFKKLAVVGIDSAAAGVAGTDPGCIVGVDDFLCRLAASDSACDFESVRELNGLIRAEPIPARRNAEKVVGRICKFVLAPLRLVGARFVHVANGNALHVRFFQKMKHHAETLRADADEGDIDFVAGWDVADAAENATGNNGEAERRGCGLRKKFAARGWGHALLRDSKSTRGAAARTAGSEIGCATGTRTLHTIEPVEYGKSQEAEAEAQAGCAEACAERENSRRRLRTTSAI